MQTCSHFVKSNCFGTSCAVFAFLNKQSAKGATPKILNPFTVRFALALGVGLHPC